MKNSKYLLASLALLLSTGSYINAHEVIIAEAAPYVVVEKQPPAEVEEVIPVKPSAEHIWRKGYWTWDHGQWVHVKGEWIVRPHPAAVWVDGHWARRPHGWVWIHGHWE